jgi:hypothetical protein
MEWRPLSHGRSQNYIITMVQSAQYKILMNDYLLPTVTIADKFVNIVRHSLHARVFNSRMKLN